MNYILQTARYGFRPLQQEDAPALLRCYSDENAVRRMNSDHCQGTFLMKTTEDVRNAIRFWQKDASIVRLCIVDLEENAPVGTAELHRKAELDAIVLRIDLCSAHETTDRLAEILPTLYEEGFRQYPTAESAVMKAYPHNEARCEALRRCGFEGEKVFCGFAHYYELARPFRGVAPCGLVCKYCSERIGCKGCRRISDPTCPCDAEQIAGLRIRTFAAYARTHGAQALLAHLDRKAAQGVRYHRDGLTGDYDGFSTEEELIAFLES